MSHPWAQTTKQCPRTYTRTMFRTAARAAFRRAPYTRTERAQLRKFIRCQRPGTTASRHRRGQRRLRVALRRHKRAYARRQAVARVTPFRGPDGRRWAIPWPIVSCESGGSFTAYNDGYEPDGPGSGPGGAYQIIRSTWQANGGRGVARYAAPAQQHMVASRIWNGAGRGQWQC